jgi:hypothetical protein
MILNYFIIILIPTIILTGILLLIFEYYKAKWNE